MSREHIPIEIDNFIEILDYEYASNLGPWRFIEQMNTENLICFYRWAYPPDPVCIETVAVWFTKGYKKRNV